MNSKNGKSSKVWIIIGVLFLSLTCLYISAHSVMSIVGCATAQTSVDEMLHAQSTTKYVDGKAQLVTYIGQVNHSVNLIPTGTDYYYLIFAKDENICMTVKAPDSWDTDYFNDVYKMGGLSLGYAPDGVPVNGQVKKLDSHGRSILRDAMNDFVNKKGGNFTTTEYYLDLTAARTGWLGAISMLLILTGGLSFFIWNKKFSATRGNRLVIFAAVTLTIGVIGIVFYL